MDGVSVREVALLQLTEREAIISEQVQQAIDSCGSNIGSSKRADVQDRKLQLEAIRRDLSELRAEIHAMREPRNKVGAGCVVTIKNGKDRRQFAILRIASGVNVEKDGEKVIVLSDTNSVAAKLMFRKVGDRVEMHFGGEASNWTVEKIE